jgi:hypothetical protein
MLISSLSALMPSQPSIKDVTIFTKTRNIKGGSIMVVGSQNRGGAGGMPWG